MSTNDVWSRIGDENPYFGVITDTKYMGKDLDARRLDEFYETGEREIGHRVQLMKSIWSDFDPSELIAADFGCGVGRLLLAMAKRCKHAIGIDISRGMLEKAKTILADRGYNNTTLFAYDTDLSELPSGITWLHSDIVFQHIPVEQGYKLFDALLGKLAPPAFLTVQFTIFKLMKLMPHLPQPLFLKQKEIGEYTLVGTQMGFENFTADGMSMYDYDLDILSAILIKHGFRTVVTKFYEMGVSESALVIARL